MRTTELNAGLKELLGFIRINVCLYTASLAATGYLLFSRPEPVLIYVVLSSFFGCAAAYAYNNTTDLKEDLINRKKLNYFSDKPAGKAIVALCTIAGLSFALQLPVESVLVYFVFTALFVGYSSLRIKKYLLLKNIWTAFGVSQFFLIGLFASGSAVETAYYTVVFSLALIGSIIADMRDVEGDRKIGINTLSVKLGIRFSRLFLYLLYATVAGLILADGMREFYIVLPFSAIAVTLISKNRFVEAHAIGGAASFTLLAWLLIS